MHKNAQKGQVKNSEQNFLPLHMATPWSNLLVSVALSLKFFQLHQAQQKASHCSKKKRKRENGTAKKNSKIEKPTDMGQNFDFCTCPSQNVVKYNAGSKKGKLIWAKSSLKTTKKSKKCIFCKNLWDSMG